MSTLLPFLATKHGRNNLQSIAGGDIDSDYGHISLHRTLGSEINLTAEARIVDEAIYVTDIFLAGVIDYLSCIGILKQDEPLLIMQRFNRLYIFDIIITEIFYSEENAPLLALVWHLLVLKIV